MNYADLVKEITTSTSTSVITLGGAVTGFRSVASAPELAIGATDIPFKVGPDASGAWLIGLYTRTDATTLTRTSIHSSSNGGLDLTLAAGAKEVCCTISASMLAATIINPSDVGYDIVLCAGQSNMEGNPAWDQYIDIPDTRLSQFGGSGADANTYRKIVAGSDPMLMFNGARTGLIGPATWFGRTYANTVPHNRRVLLVPVAAGSTGLVANSPPWAPGNPGAQLYELAIAQANLAIAAAQAIYPNSRFVGVLWAQGEQDATYSITKAQYVAAAKALIAGWRSRITGATNSWFVISGMVPEKIAANPANYGVIDSAHKQIAAEVSRVAFVAGPTGYANDVHYTAPGVRVLGASMALAVARAKVAIGSDTTLPTATGAAVANATSSTVNITASELLDGGFVPAASAFTVTNHTVLSLALSTVGNTTSINLSVSPAFANGEAASTASYTQPGSAALRDLSGNLVASFSGLAIANNVAAAADTIPPTASSAAVANATPTFVDITMSEPMDTGFTPAATSVTVSGHTVSTVAWASSTVLRATVSAAFVNGEARTAAYTQPGTNNARDVAGNLLANFTALAITNNVGAAATIPATMTAPVATAGAASASLAFTLPSDGGSALTGLTITPYIGATAQTPQTTTTLTSPYVATGLTAGSAYTFTMHASNTVGPGADSPASNSVTPTAATSGTTWNPADSASGITLTNGNLTAAGTSGWKSTRATAGKSSGKWYWETKITVGTVGITGFGRTTAPLTSFPGGDAATNASWGYYSAGQRYYGNAVAETFATYTTNDVIGIALDMDAKTGQFYRNGVALGSPFTLLDSPGGSAIAAGVVVYPMQGVNASTVLANFGATAFTYTPPAGFSALG